MKYLVLLAFFVPSIIFCQGTTTEKIKIDRVKTRLLLNARASLGVSNEASSFSYPGAGKSFINAKKTYKTSEEINADALLKKECTDGLFKLAIADMYKNYFCTTSNCVAEPNKITIQDDGLTSFTKARISNAVNFGTTTGSSGYSTDKKPTDCSITAEALKEAIYPIYVDETGKKMTLFAYGVTVKYPFKVKLKSDPNDVNTSGEDLSFEEEYTDTYSGTKVTRTFKNTGILNLSDGPYIRTKEDAKKADGTVVTDASGNAVQVEKPLSFKLPGYFVYTTGIVKDVSLNLAFGEKYGFGTEKGVIASLPSSTSPSGLISYGYIIKGSLGDPVAKTAVCTADANASSSSTDSNKCDNSTSTKCCFMKMEIAKKI
jgi:hypothetical protein